MTILTRLGQVLKTDISTDVIFGGVLKSMLALNEPIIDVKEG